MLWKCIMIKQHKQAVKKPKHTWLSVLVAEADMAAGLESSCCMCLYSTFQLPHVTMIHCSNWALAEEEEDGCLCVLTCLRLSPWTEIIFTEPENPALYVCMLRTLGLNVQWVHAYIHGYGGLCVRAPHRTQQASVTACMHKGADYLTVFGSQPVTFHYYS